MAKQASAPQPDADQAELFAGDDSCDTPDAMLSQRFPATSVTREIPQARKTG